jgi:type I restriction enzyme S subunit
VIRGSNLSENIERRLIHDGLVFVSKEKAKDFRRSVARKGDLVFTCWGTIGQVGLIDGRCPYDEYVISNKQMKLTPHPAKADSLFLYYLFSGTEVSEQIKGQTIGSSVPGFNLGQLRSIRLRIPPLPEQRAIASVLGGLDDKIELNRRMNETLEAMARALFQNWFVDATQAGLPKGWEVRGLDGIANFLNGLALQKFPPNGDDSLPVIKIAQLRAGHTVGADRASIDLPPQYIIEDGDVLFSWSGSLEVEIWCGGSGALNQHLFKVTSVQFPKWFYYLWTRHHLTDFQNTAANKATTMGHIQRHHLSEAKVFVPPPALMETMDKQFAPVVDKLIANRLESRTLAALRAALLPRLLSGELRVPAAAKLVEARA